jgi:hypothetical protein
MASTCKGTKVYAMRGGTVRFAGNRGQDGYSSRHVVLEVDDSNDGLMSVVYGHFVFSYSRKRPGCDEINRPRPMHRPIVLENSQVLTEDHMIDRSLAARYIPA